ANPVFELLAGHLPHLRTSAADELQIGIQLAQAAHQRNAVIVSAHFAGDEVDGHSSVVAAVPAAKPGVMQAIRLPLQWPSEMLLRTRRDLLRYLDRQIQG